MSLLTDLVIRLHDLNNVELERLARELERIRVLASKDNPTEPVNVYQGGNPQYVSLGGETNDVLLWSGADLIIYSDTGTTEKGRWDGATGNITTAGTVDGIDIAALDAVVVKHTLADAANDFLVASGDDTFVKKTLAETGAILEADLDHGNIQGLSDDDHPQYVLHSLADAANDFLVASGDDTFVKKTLAETGAILEGDLDHGNLQGLDTGADHSYIDQDVTATGSPTFAGVLVNTTAGYDVTPGSDTDTDLITLNVTGTPRLWWDESHDGFAFNKGLDVVNNTSSWYYGMTVGRSLTDPSVSVDGLNVTITTNLTANNARAHTGLRFTVQSHASSTHNFTGNMYGLVGFVNHLGAGTASVMGGFKGGTQIIGAGNISTSYGLLAQSSLGASSAGSITNHYGLFVQTPTKTGGASGDFINIYGVYVADQNTATTLNYAIYTGLGAIRFGDYVTIDQASSTGAKPVLFLDQGDVSEQCIKFSSDATDRDIHLFTVNVTGTPAMDWLETPDVFAINKALRGTISHWWASQHFSVTSLSPGASGATFVAPDANTAGGYNLDADNEYLYFDGHAHSDWDAGSDMELKFVFEVDVDNTGGSGGDVAVFDAEVYLKGVAETATKNQSLTDSITIDQSARYKQFEASMTIDYDSGTDPIDAGDTISFRINFDATNSDITDVILNHITLKYKTAKMNEEV